MKRKMTPAEAEEREKLRQIGIDRINARKSRPKGLKRRPGGEK